MVGADLGGLVKGLKVEVESAYRRNDVGGAWVVSQTGGTTIADDGTIEANISTFTVMANIWYEVALGKVKPYIGGGAGWGHAMLDGAVIDGDGVAIDQSFDFSEGDFAWQAGAGFNYEAAPGVDVGIGYRYARLPDFTLPFTIDPDNGGPQTFGEVENENHAVTFNLTVDID